MTWDQALNIRQSAVCPRSFLRPPRGRPIDRSQWATDNHIEDLHEEIHYMGGQPPCERPPYGRPPCERPPCGKPLCGRQTFGRPPAAPQLECHQHQMETKHTISGHILLSWLKYWQKPPSPLCSGASHRHCQHTKTYHCSCYYHI